MINVLDLAGCIVTRRFGGKLPPKSSLTIADARPSGSPTRKAHQADAMGCQREIVRKIVNKEADYVIAVKKNQPSLYEQVEQLFKQAIKTGGEGLNMSSFKSKELNKGREEIRNYSMISDLAILINPFLTSYLILIPIDLVAIVVNRFNRIDRDSSIL